MQDVSVVTNVDDSISISVSDVSNKRNPLIKRNVLKSQHRLHNSIPDDILNNVELLQFKKTLPSNYNFEIEKTIAKIRLENAKIIGLQFPEGLLMYACILSDIFIKFNSVKVIILGDVTYGACCVDDYTAKKLGIDLLVHYGHSCLVPLQVTKVKVMYVFIEIQFDTSHLVDIIKTNFMEKEDTKTLALMGTIQFTNSIFSVHAKLREELDCKNIIIPQCKPLSPGETLGCTSPKLPLECTKVIFVADGRFHMESAMIQNPHAQMYRYDPYSKVITVEGYDIELMRSNRLKDINRAKDAKIIGLILGTLGRQGNTQIFQRLQKLALKHNKTVIPFLMAEINPMKLKLIQRIDAWVQVACPRLSIDWAGGFDKPILTPYEFEVVMNESLWKEIYPMDYYSKDAGSWGNYFIE